MMKPQKVLLLGLLLALLLSIPALAQDDPVELDFWTWKIFHVPGLEVVAANFEAETGIKVNVQAFNPDEVYRTKITTSEQSDELPDILSYWSGGQWELAATDNLVELTDLVDQEWADLFLPATYDLRSVMTQDTYDNCQGDPECTYSNIEVGQSFSVPYLAGQAFFVYGNKALMEEAGLDPNTPPATAEEWLDMMITIKEETGVAGLVTGVQNADVLNFWLFNPMLITSCGPETYDAIYRGEMSFTEPCALSVLEWINQISVNDLWMPGILSTNIDPADVAFAQERAAFDIGGTYTLGFLIEQGMDPDNLISFAVPPLADSMLPVLEIAPAPLIDAMVTTDSEHPEEALQFLRFLTSPEQMEIFAKTVGDLPAVKVSADPERVGNVMPGLLNAISEYSPFQDATAPQLDDMRDVLKLGLQQFILGEVTPEELAANVDEANASAWAERNG